MDAVRSCLGPRDVAVCGIAQYKIMHHSCHGHHVRGAQQLAPLKGPRRKLQPGWDDVPGAVRPRQGRPLAVAGLEIGHLRLHHRRRHVLRLLFHRPLPGCRDLRVRRGRWRRAATCVGRRPNKGAAGGDLCVRRGRPAAVGAEAKADRWRRRAAV